jgi:hypothetical protein
MRKIRPDSLYAKLEAANLLDEFYTWLFGSQPSYEEMLAWFKAHNIATSNGAIHTLIHVHALNWKVFRALQAEEEVDGTLPADVDEKIRTRLKQNEFDLVFSELSNKERLSLLSLQEKREERLLDTEKFRAALKSDLEKGIDALREECSRNAAALQAWEKLRELVLGTVEAAA